MMVARVGGPLLSPRLAMMSSSGVVPSVKPWEYSMGVYRDPNREFDALHADLVGGKINEGWPSAISAYCLSIVSHLWVGGRELYAKIEPKLYDANCIRIVSAKIV
jgi:hypothetical protein